MPDQKILQKKLVLGMVEVVFFLTSGLFNPLKAQVVISEIYPNPKEGQSEWFEVFNPTNQTITLTDLEAWDQLSQPSKLLTFKLTLDPKQAKVVLLPTNKLNNSGDTLSLKDSEGNLIDQVQFNQTSKGKSYTLTNLDPVSFSWQEPSPDQVSLNLSGLISPSTTPEASLSATLTPRLTPTSELSPTQTPTPTASPPNPPTPTAYLLKVQDLKLTEVMACPEKDQPEWFEIYWQITETLQTQLTLEDETQNRLEFNLTTKPDMHQVLELNKNMLNNTGDKIRLLNAKEQLLEELTLPACQTGQSYALIGDNWLLTHSSTPQRPNPTPLPSITLTLTKEKNLNQTSPDSFSLSPTHQQVPSKLTKRATLRLKRPLPTLSQASSSGQVLGAATTHSTSRSSFLSSLSVIMGGVSFLASGSIYFKPKKKDESNQN